MLRLLAVFALSLLSGCASIPVGDENANPAPSSSYAQGVLESDASLWAMLGPGRNWSGILPTGSMAPLLDSRSIVLYEVYTGQSLHVGDWIVYDRGDLPNVLHRILEIRGDYLFISGVNVPRSDGWFHKSKVRFRVVGVLYGKRD